MKNPQDMGRKMGVPPVSASYTPDKSSESKLGQISQNIETILAFYTREEQKISRSQRVLENISGILGQPLYLVSILLFVALWMLANIFARHAGMAVIDPAPFFWLQGMVSLGALLTSTAVVIKQNRLAKLEEKRAHLDLQVNLLTEQKVTKLINLMEELRRDLPMVKDRHDPDAAAFQQPTNPHVVLAALDEQRETVERSKHAEEAEEKVDGSK
ncbi:MAG: DUF1003 domain-containing protein [Gammaproteobacteria bacterium]